MPNLSQRSRRRAPESVPAMPRGGRSLRAHDALRASGVPQVAALAGCALHAGAIAAGVTLRSRVRRESAAQRRERVAEAVAARVARTLGSQKGVYAKLGQFASLRLDVLPGPVTGALATLRDQVPPLPFERVRRSVEAELEAPLERLFATFDPAPLGAASIAQVHAATLHGGERVVVKVQYPWLEASFRADLAIARTALRWIARARRHDAASTERLFEEFAAGLHEELDFEREARIAREIGENLSGDDRVVVPEIVGSHSTRRVLTMRRHPAVGLGDRAGLARLGVRPAEVLQVVARAYASQIFVDGLFHADPHPGNLFVIDEPTARERPRVLFVDFGLSRRLEPALRRELRLGLFALMQRDADAFLDGMDRMGMIAPGARAGVRDAVEAMLARIASGGGALGLAGGQVLPLKDEAKRLLQQTPGLQLPNDLLLYAKTLSYVFALGAQLDADVDLMKLSLPYLLRFLAEKDPGSALSPARAGPGAAPGAG